MKTKKIIRKLYDNEFELSEKDRLEILGIILHYPALPTTTEVMQLEEILKKHTQH